MLIITFFCSTKHQKCLSCDQETWELPIEDHCDYFITSCDPSLVYCLLHCQGIMLTLWSIATCHAGPHIPYSLLMKYRDGELSPGKELTLSVTKFSGYIMDNVGICNGDLNRRAQSVHKIYPPHRGLITCHCNNTCWEFLFMLSLLNYKFKWDHHIHIQVYL